MAQVCAIVGSGQGLGAALAARFAKEGCDIALLSRTQTGSAAAMEAAQTERPDAAVQFYSADATKPETIETALSTAAEDLGAIDILIYNVRDSFDQCAPLEMSYEALEKTLRCEVIGAFAAAKSVLPAMRERGCGTIFFSSATAAFRGSSTYPLYAIGKFGLRALSQSLAKAYAQDGVHIVHMRLDCDLNTDVMNEIYGGADRSTDGLADPADVAMSYWLAHLQPRSAWSNEIELRPHTEKWTF